MVSMPYHGLSSFLPIEQQIAELQAKRFNALPRAFFFSTLYEALEVIHTTSTVSMPYHGLSSFLQAKRHELIKKITVSMPYHGLSSFLLVTRLDNGSKYQCFNALPRAFFFSTFRYDP